MSAFKSSLRKVLQLLAVAVMAIAVTMTVSVASAYAAENPAQAAPDRTTAREVQLPSFPAMSTRFCFTFTGPGACVKYSQADLDRFEAVGIIGGAVSAAAGAEYICNLVPRAGFKVACKGVIAGYYTQTVVVLRAAQEQNRCMEIKVGFNPVAGLIDRPYLVDC